MHTVGTERVDRPEREAPVVLLVDDNPDDRELARLAIGSLPSPPGVLQAADGLEALERLRGAEPRPSLVLLDLNMPRLDGKQFLRQLRADPVHALTPVVILTTSTAPWDVEESHAEGCNLYLVKPFAVEEIARVLGDVFQVFLGHAELPR